MQYLKKRLPTIKKRQQLYVTALPNVIIVTFKNGIYFLFLNLLPPPKELPPGLPTFIIAHLNPTSEEA